MVFLFRQCSAVDRLSPFIIIMADPEKAMDVEAAEEEEEVEEEEEDKKKLKAITAEMLRDPEVLAHYQRKLQSMVGASSGYIQSLPKVVKQRIKALKKLQFDTTKIEAQFYVEVHALECKYASMYEPLFEKRRQVVNAEHEPTNEECDWPSDDEELSDEMKSKAKLEEDGEKKNDTGESKMSEDTKGIPEFWLTIFKNVEMLAEMVQEHDEPILKHLTDITVHMQEEPMGFTLKFHFSPNEYFNNTVLTKVYFMKSEASTTDPFTFEGAEIFKCTGCTIDWKKGKNVTVKTIKKKQKHKARGSTRTVTKTIQNDSFFNFFDPPSIPDQDGEASIDEDIQSIITADFEIGHYIRERIVPHAVLYFTGEALDEDDFEEEECDESAEEEDDPDYEPPKDGTGQTGQNAPDCKQQ